MMIGMMWCCERSEWQDTIGWFCIQSAQRRSVCAVLLSVTQAFRLCVLVSCPEVRAVAINIDAVWRVVRV